jgi:hypothetical protein
LNLTLVAFIEKWRSLYTKNIYNCWNRFDHLVGARISPLFGRCWGSLCRRTKLYLAS